MTTARDPQQLRSQRWFGPDDLRSFGHRSRLKGMGFDDVDYRDRPIVAMLNTWSEMTTCHSHFRERAEEVRRGILQAGGFPLEVPVLSLGEMLMKPTTMMYRNLLAMEVEEVLRAHPIDAAVLMGGCDKTVPAMLMGAISAGVPSIFFPAGPMLKARWRNETLGSGSDAWKYWAERRAGNLCDAAWGEIENCIARSAGTCMTMGTASTMAIIAETLGFTLPMASSIPAVVAEHQRLAVATGRRAVEIAWERLTPAKIATESAFDDAITALMTIGGSTNAIVHLIAMAGRAGIKLTLDRFDTLSRRTPVLADVRPGGRFLMEDFHHAGGLPALLTRLTDLIDVNRLTITGRPLSEQIAGAEVLDDQIIRTRENAMSAEGGLCVLYGNLAPQGAVIKSIASTQSLLDHRGQAVVFEDYPDLKKRLNDPSLGITAESIIVLKTAGPIGAPGMPEWGMLPLPDHLLRAGVRDMVRISDARMSGTSYGTCVLHVAPESSVGGPLALVRTGDWIHLDVASRRLQLEVTEEELEQRRRAWVPPMPRFKRGFGQLLSQHMTQADQGCDFDFLVGSSPDAEPDIF